MNLRSHRIALGISQSRLARISGVSRFKICTYELGDSSLTATEQNRIREALTAEADRLRRIPFEINIDFSGAAPASGGQMNGPPAARPTPSDPGRFQGSCALKHRSHEMFLAACPKVVSEMRALFGKPPQPADSKRFASHARFHLGATFYTEPKYMKAERKHSRHEMLSHAVVGTRTMSIERGLPNFPHGTGQRGRND